jgi:hypothetical protein
MRAAGGAYCPEGAPKRDSIRNSAQLKGSGENVRWTLCSVASGGTLPWCGKPRGMYRMSPASSTTSSSRRSRVRGCGGSGLVSIGSGISGAYTRQCLRPDTCTKKTCTLSKCRSNPVLLGGVMYALALVGASKNCSACCTSSNTGRQKLQGGRVGGGRGGGGEEA